MKHWETIRWDRSVQLGVDMAFSHELPSVW